MGADEKALGIISFAEGRVQAVRLSSLSPSKASERSTKSSVCDNSPTHEPIMILRRSAIVLFSVVATAISVLRYAAAIQ